ncbi:MAG TPA: helix-turn-helix domain-containing protein [Microbacterium sp.]|uniref:winged helix-turn-helix transcriptional regulator n=1 Tax=Microbacterium sp. TaxID=51671 RepID=UPI002B6CFDA5|nr:helix-turn-helix domain-containing protein [Microbacterium sp.]HWI30850.1 helix-turn-helix domain-containing protein [Microbacterium sp.]
MSTTAESGRARPHSDYEHVCATYPHDGPAIRGVLDRVGDKWSLLLIITLEAGPLRYGQLKRQVVGVSQRMLTLTLRQLERDGLVARTVYPQIPPRVEYELTHLGATLIPPARSIAHWALANYSEIEKARKRFDQATEANDAPGMGGVAARGS